jgi:hypothetical protein
LHKVIEINLNSQPSQEIIALAAACGCRFALNFDAHEFTRYKWQQSALVQAGEAAKTRWGQNRATEQDMELLTTYKRACFTEGPGVIAPLRLKRWIDRLQMRGVTADRIINSSLETLLHFLTRERGKTTANLEQLTNTS